MSDENRSEALLMLVSLRIAPAQEAAFNDFYHHRYLPALLRVAPEIEAVWRYEEFGVAGNLRWFNKQYLTQYLLKPGVSAAQIEEALERPGREPEKEEWARWRDAHLVDLERHCYREIYRHRREPTGGIFASRPFFRVSVETDPARTEAFDHWYHEEYLPKIMADVPAWVATRRYRSLDREPTRVHTVYEVESVAALDEAFSLMRAPHRYGSNADWDAWVGDAIRWQDATSFRPIYRAPG
jgi:hypothetical protein